MSDTETAVTMQEFKEVADHVKHLQAAFISLQNEVKQNTNSRRGIPGGKGEPGQDGKAASIRIGSITTAPAGTPASVGNTGTPTDAVLDFVIPVVAGKNGRDGVDGVGKDGKDGAPGTIDREQAISILSEVALEIFATIQGRELLRRAMIQALGA